MSAVIARLTVTREDNSRVIVEVSTDATFHQFFKFYSQQGSKRSTKQLIRSASRNEGLHPVNAHLQIPGLEVLALRFLHNRFGKSPVASVKVRYLSKRLYKKLTTMAADQLGQGKVHALFDDTRAIRVSLPRTAAAFKLVEKKNHFKIHAGAR